MVHASLTVAGPVAAMPSHVVLARWHHTEHSEVEVWPSQSLRLWLATARPARDAGTWYVPYSYDDSGGEIECANHSTEPRSDDAPQPSRPDPVSVTVVISSNPPSTNGPITHGITILDGEVLR